jgi:hypothetical protein|tara:strand:+ start:2449 stop:3051 length:603 start_codon:yes stop_codon:yes gene_type:complete
VATHDYVIANGTGAAVRSDLNGVLSAIASNNSNATDPATTFAYQFYADTGDNTLYIRNAANNAYVAVSAVGGIGTTNFGLAPTASPTFTGTADFNSNTAIKVCDGTTAQRPGSASVGMLRYNTTTNSFEGYSGSSPAWGEIGGGGGATGTGTDQIFLNYGQTVTGSYSIPASTNSLTAGPVSVASGQSVTIPSGSNWTIV